MSHFIGDQRLGYPVVNNGVSASLNSSDNLSIGLATTPRSILLFGLIDDIRIYDRALSEDEVRLIYDLEGALPNGAVTYAKLAPALQDLVDGNGSIFASLPAGSVIAVDANQTAPLGIYPF